MVNAEAGPSRPSSPDHRKKDTSIASDVEIPPILRLPPELFDTFLHHVPPQDLQSTALALSRVFPDHPISRVHLWKHVVARNPAQMVPMWRKMREMKGKRKDGGPEATRTFSMVSPDQSVLLSGSDVDRSCTDGSRKRGKVMPISSTSTLKPQDK